MERVRGAATPMPASEAVALIPDGATVAVGGFVGAGHPELLTAALEQHFLQTGGPQGLTLVYAAGQGDREHRGLNHLAHKGLLKRVVGGHWNLAPKLGQLALENEIEAYNLPQGVLCVLLREIAAKRPGVFTRVGLHTFIDPELMGGRLNQRAQEPLVERITLDGEIYLRYRAFPITVGLIRGTRADRLGNLSMDREALIGDSLPIAQAAKNHGGLVIAQVEEIVDRIADPKSVRVPGILVDALVVADKKDHWQTFGEEFNPEYVCSADGAGPSLAPLPFSERKIIARRALQEIPRGSVVNLGIGLPEAVAALAAEEGRLGDFTLTVESGPIAGVPASGLSFGCSHFPEAIIDQPSQFDFYDGGGIDVAALGAVEVDALGNVCVSQMAGRFVGVGGFANISLHAKTVLFCFSFTAGGLQVAASPGGLSISREGGHRKFVEAVNQICFHGPTSSASNQKVLYITERAVFRLTPQGLELAEVAPCIDLERDILALMPFPPIVKHIQPMPAQCFQP